MLKKWKLEQNDFLSWWLYTLANTTIDLKIWIEIFISYRCYLQRKRKKVILMSRASTSRVEHIGETFRCGVLVVTHIVRACTHARARKLLTVFCVRAAKSVVLATTAVICHWGPTQQHSLLPSSASSESCAREKPDHWVNGWGKRRGWGQATYPSLCPTRWWHCGRKHAPADFTQQACVHTCVTTQRERTGLGCVCVWCGVGTGKRWPYWGFLVSCLCLLPPFTCGNDILLYLSCSLFFHSSTFHSATHF